MPNHACPKCGKNMVKGSMAQSGKRRWECSTYSGSHKTYCFSTTNPGTPATDRAGKRSSKAPIFKRTLGKVERFLVTAAQNATPVHKGFVNALEVAANKHSAEILVIPLRYKNPTSSWSASQKNEETWAPEVSPYLWNTRKALNQNLHVVGDAKIQPTASNPLTGFDGLTHGESAIFGHTKLQLRTVPVPSGKLPKIMTTTGACTKPNYTDSRAGKLGEFHHTLGACMVEIRGREFHIRQINAESKTGAFIDLDTYYGIDWAKKGYAPAPRALALDMGDTHVDAVDPAVDRATFGKGGIVDLLNPAELIWHDLLDGDSINPHHRGNPFLGVHKRQFGMDNAEAEVQRAVAFLDARTKGGRLSVVVPSNHDDFLTRYLIATDWRQDATNAEFYLESALAMVRQAKSKDANAEKLSAFTYWVARILGSRPDVKCLANDESHVVAGIETGLHGDKGPNGARGSLKNLRRIGVKVIVGHSHSPGIDEGGYQNGTSTRLRLGYNSGPSSWLNAHTVIYGNGKRSLLNVINGRWRLE